jgi:peptidoglycan hydrolase CwlO-like protein
MDAHQADRKELDRLWDRHTSLTQEVNELKIQTNLVNERVERINNDIHESNGRIAQTLDNIASRIDDLAHRLLSVELVGSTKSRMLDRWLPMLIAAAAVVVAALNLVNGQ